MGMQIFEETGVFDPSIWDLGAGDVIQVIVIGGGGGGAGGCASYSGTVPSTYDVKAQRGGDGGRGGGNGEDRNYGTTGGGGGGGGGYGGGGGGGGGLQNLGGAGGGSGYVKCGVVKLENSDQIAAVCGEPGKGGDGGFYPRGTSSSNSYKPANDGTAGGTSSFGEYISALGGSGGIAYIPESSYLPTYGSGNCQGGVEGRSAGSSNSGGGGGGGGGGFDLSLPATSGGYGGTVWFKENVPIDFPVGSSFGTGGGGGSHANYDAIPGTSYYGGSGGRSNTSGQDGGTGRGAVIVFW